MIRQVGTQVLLSTTIRDTTGAPVNTPTVTLSVTKPDGTVVAPAPTVNNTGSNGVYTATVTPDQPGLWLYMWTSSGSVSVTQSDQFTAVAGQRALVASLDEFKKHLNRADTADDDELRTHLTAATDVVEYFLGGPLGVATFTERRTIGGSGSGYAGIGRLAFTYRPVVSIISITPDFAGPLDPSSYVLDKATGTAQLWTWWRGWMTVIYKAGYQNVFPERVKLGGLIQAQHFWETQNGFAGRRPPDEYTPPGLGYAVPNRVKELLTLDDVPGIA